jgi:hypothetical protein
VASGCVVTVDVSHVAPAGATGIALNVTTTDAPDRGFVTVWGCDFPMPATSNVNPRVDDPTPNLVIVPIGATRTVCLRSFAATNLIVDATGWFGLGDSLYHELQPMRIVDTRTALRPDTATGPLPAGSVLTVPITGRAVNGLQGPVTIPANATGVALNLTVTEPADAGYATAYPCGTAVPPSSTVDFRASENRANQTIVGLGHGAVCIFVFASTHVVIDLAGWFGPGDSGVPLQPVVGTRLVDSRNGTGGFAGPLNAGETRSFDPRAQAPRGAQSLLLNVVATDAAGPGYLTLYPCSSGQPPTSSVNYAPGAESTNLVTVPLGQDGKICVYSFGRTDVVIDLLGSFGAPGTLRAMSFSGLALDPPFRPDVTDYTLHCTKASNAISISALAMPGHTVSLNGKPAATDVDAKLVVAPSQAVVVAARAAGTNIQYSVRCLPLDFPRLTVNRTGVVPTGYYLLENGIAGGPNRYLMILDHNGVPVWYRKVVPGEVNFELLADGTLASMPFVRTVFNIDPSVGFNLRRLDGTIVRTVKAVGVPTDYHDLVRMPNGDYLVVAYRVRTGATPPPGSPSCGDNHTVVDGIVQEVTPSGAVVGSWSTQTHVSPSEVVLPLCDSTAVTGSNPPTNAIDYAHINAVDYDPHTNQVIVTARHLDAVLWINWSTKKVVRKLGGKGTNPDAPAVFTFAGPASNAFALPHDGRLNANGHLTVMDNQAAPLGTGQPRAAEYALNTTAKTATLVWQRPLGGTGSLFGGLGSVRRQPDGDTVIAWGGFNKPAFTEVDAAGNALLEVDLPIANLTYRVEKVYGLSLAELRATAGK